MEEKEAAVVFEGGQDKESRQRGWRGLGAPRPALSKVRPLVGSRAQCSSPKDGGNGLELCKDSEQPEIRGIGIEIAVGRGNLDQEGSCGHAASCIFCTQLPQAALVKAGSHHIGRRMEFQVRKCGESTEQLDGGVNAKLKRI